MSNPGYLATTSYHAHVFDFDGTIAETGNLNLEALCAALANAGAVVDVEWLRTEPLTSIEAVRQRLRRERGVILACSNSAIHQMGRAYWMAHTADLRPVAEVMAIIRSSAVPMAVASANDTQVVRAGLAALGLGQAFGAVVGRDEVTRPKPHPEVYLTAAARLGVAAPRCLAFDNTDDGVASALAAGMDVIDVRTWNIHKPESERNHDGPSSPRAHVGHPAERSLQQHGRWGTWADTREETAYAIQILAYTGVAAVPDQTIEFLSAADDTAHPPLWIAKDPYCPTAIVEAAILAAIRLSGQSAKPHPNSRFPRTHPDSQAGAA